MVVEKLVYPNENRKKRKPKKDRKDRNTPTIRRFNAFCRDLWSLIGRDLWSLIKLKRSINKIY